MSVPAGPAGAPAGTGASRISHESLLAAFRAALVAGPDQPALHYFDTTLSWGDLDRASDALAQLLTARGFGEGDRLALCVQNNPAFVIGLVAAWKAQGIPALISPLSKRVEFAGAVADLAPRALLCLDDVYEDVARGVLESEPSGIQIVVTVSPLDFQSRDDQRMFAGRERRQPADTVDLARLVAGRPRAGEGGSSFSAVRAAPHDIAVIAPTSGTTGAPKGAMLSHHNILFGACAYREAGELVEGEAVLAMSPVFHVTGLVGAVALGLVARSPVVLTHRFAPLVVLEAVRRWQPVFTIAAITAYKALAAEPQIAAGDLESLRVRYSGGLPVEPHVVDALETRLGGYIHNAYGQTETASPSHLVPFGHYAPVDADTGVLSVGVPVPGTVVSVVDPAGDPVAPGEFGEIITSGPQVMRGYWGRPAESADALAGGGFATGDIGFVDADGWLFVVDRSSDVINAAGYKIWPFEVEQVLTTHPAVREAAVVDIVDDYRGQSTRAYVALEQGYVATAAELIEYSRARLAAYKYPREIEIVEALPRTATGKLLRRQLRAE